jgi:hypothetical protein
MHQPGYVQGGQEASFGYLLLGIYYRRIPGDTIVVKFFFDYKHSSLKNLKIAQKVFQQSCYVLHLNLSVPCLAKFCVESRSGIAWKSGSGCEL